MQLITYKYFAMYKLSSRIDKIKLLTCKNENGHFQTWVYTSIRCNKNLLYNGRFNTVYFTQLSKKKEKVKMREEYNTR